MPDIETHLVTVTVQYEVRGDPEDYAAIAKVAQNAVRPALTPPRRYADTYTPAADYPLISHARLAGIEISNPRP